VIVLTVNTLADTYRIGMAIVLGATCLILIALNGMEVFCAWKGWPSLGYRAERWSINNPWYVGFVLLILGTFLAHFFLNALPFPPT
jgi:hypothetical protein